MMKIRMFLLAAAAVTCSACSGGRVAELESENENLRRQVSTLEHRLSATQDAVDEVRMKAAQVQSASEEMQGQVSRFDGENWRDVVPDVQSASSGVDDAQSSLDGAVSDLDDGTEQ